MDNINNIVIRKTTLRKNNICCHCSSELLKGEIVAVKTWKEEHTIHRQYYCSKCAVNQNIIK